MFSQNNDTCTLHFFIRSLSTPSGHRHTAPLLLSVRAIVHASMSSISYRKKKTSFESSNEIILAFIRLI